jgi:acetylornithine deacetylase/succinyl-diaminopimelate desuccinylase-like protein
VLLYSHYDVVPVGDESKWESPPFEATERDGAIYGRGAADSKSNILMHVGALRAWGGKPPVGIKIVIEGQEETGSAFSTFPPTRPELTAADAMVVGDMGSIARAADAHHRTSGMAVVTIGALAGPKHSGHSTAARMRSPCSVARLHARQARRRRRAGLATGGVNRGFLRRRGSQTLESRQDAVHRHRRARRAPLVGRLSP